MNSTPDFMASTSFSTDVLFPFQGPIHLSLSPFKNIFLNYKKKTCSRQKKAHNIQMYTEFLKSVSHTDQSVLQSSSFGNGFGTYPSRLVFNVHAYNFLPPVGLCFTVLCNFLHIIPDYGDIYTSFFSYRNEHCCISH